MTTKVVLMAALLVAACANPPQAAPGDAVGENADVVSVEGSLADGGWDAPATVSRMDAELPIGDGGPDAPDAPGGDAITAADTADGSADGGGAFTADGALVPDGHADLSVPAPDVSARDVPAEGLADGTATASDARPDAASDVAADAVVPRDAPDATVPVDPDPPIPGPTDLTRHRYSRVVTLDTTAAGANVADPVPNYPVAVILDATSFDFAQAQPGGQDIRFATRTGALLPYAVELWDAAAKRAALWVKFDVAGNDATQSFVMHWGNPAASSASSHRTVFSTQDGFLGVYHLGEEGNTTPDGYRDSSANGAHGTGVAMEPGSAQPARIGNGQLLANPQGEGKNQWVKVDGPKVTTAFNATAVHPITASIWAYANSFGGYYETVFSKGDTSWSLHRDYMGRMEACTWSGSYHSCAITGRPTLKVWTHYMVVQTTTTLTLYVNGRRVASAGSFGRTGTHAFGIGSQTQYSTNQRREWDGLLDEARVMSVARDASWAQLDYESQREGSTFLRFGPVTTR